MGGQYRCDRHGCWEFGSGGRDRGGCRRGRWGWGLRRAWRRRCCRRDQFNCRWLRREQDRCGGIGRAWYGGEGNRGRRFGRRRSDCRRSGLNGFRRRGDRFERRVRTAFVCDRKRCWLLRRGCADQGQLEDGRTQGTMGGQPDFGLVARHRALAMGAFDAGGAHSVINRLDSQQPPCHAQASWPLKIPDLARKRLGDVMWRASGILPRPENSFTNGREIPMAGDHRDTTGQTAPTRCQPKPPVWVRPALAHPVSSGFTDSSHERPRQSVS